VIRYARPCAGHPRLSLLFLSRFFLVSFLGLKTWMAGIRPGHDGVETSVQASIATALPKARGGEHRSTAA
jgi:hypothetical protein